jgi:16S rRNA (guanine966-N2)-methyltransferase
MFGSLGDRVDGARVLDLYAGSGAYGLEALSRGAAQAVLVDSDARALTAAKANAEAAGLADRVRLVRRDVAAFLKAGARGRRFDLVFCDPPYADADAASRILPRLAGFLSPAARVVVELRKRPEEAPQAPGYFLEADRRYGDTRVLVYSREGGGA